MGNQRTQTFTKILSAMPKATCFSAHFLKKFCCYGNGFQLIQMKTILPRWGPSNWVHHISSPFICNDLVKTCIRSSPASYEQSGRCRVHIHHHLLLVVGDAKYIFLCGLKEIRTFHFNKDWFHTCSRIVASAPTPTVFIEMLWISPKAYWKFLSHIID